MSRLTPDTLLSIHLGAIMSRNRYTKNPAPVIAELFQVAGSNTRILAESVGSWVGFYEDGYTRVLCVALRELPDLEPWIAQGVHRRSMRGHSTPPVAYGR